MNLHVASKVKSVDLLFDYLTPALPRRWTHFCVVYKEEGQSASVFQVINDNMILTQPYLGVLITFTGNTYMYSLGRYGDLQKGELDSA